MSLSHPIISFSTRQTTLLSQLLNEICHQFRDRMYLQSVQCFVELDADESFPCDTRRLRPSIEYMVDDALSRMPEGGELDITVCTGSQGLEIEIADSGDTSDPALKARAYQPICAAGPPDMTHSSHRYEVAVCPQGGLARTLVVAWPEQRAAA